ncbi:ATP-dependent RNA helicase, putative [Plasmodium sp. gorilla clade G2]|uniref:ATP-dependent RNA helicase, putative n=1 Tax=Plasmodium sp. gorilla clade G2 TaxID=880535 RepID=UPI000D211EA0|nr:ATP-dependent RNA helicase, putative [Plasmodium sp. gorilla clade G2]SOV11038.1 ATP-dependent RNA helicase, putative [Plasmodium sp. gorilla clade G2]
MNDSDEEKYFQEDDNEEEKLNNNAKNEDNPNEEHMDTLEEFMLEINKVIEEEKKKEEEDLEAHEYNNFYNNNNLINKRNKDVKNFKDNILIDTSKNDNTKYRLYDNSLDDNDVTADIYEYLEKQKEICDMELKRKRKKSGELEYNDIENIYIDNDKTLDDRKIKKRKDKYNEYDIDDEKELSQHRCKYDYYDDNNNNNNNNDDDIILDDINYNNIHIEEFEKNIFVIDENVSSFTLEESVEYKKKNNIISMGFNIPKPLYSLLQIKNLIDHNVLQKIYDTYINTLLPIQSMVIPIFLSGRDHIVTSNASTGKTLSYIISLIIHLMHYKKRRKNNIYDINKKEKKDCHNKKNNNNYSSSSTHALIITPTRELCIQIYNDINKICSNKLKTCVLCSGMDYKKIYDDIKKETDIIICCVKTLISFINKKYLSLVDVKYIIIDEFDILFSKQYVHMVTSVLKNIRTDSIKGMFSSIVSEPMYELIKPYLNKKYITLKIENKYSPINQKFYILQESSKYNYLINNIKKFHSRGQGFIFCNSKKNVMLLYEKLKKEISLNYISFDFIYGDLLQTERIYKYEKLKNKQTNILITTDLMSIGIDLINLNFVINYDCPTDIFIYIHRTGRCCSIDNEGEAITFILPSEKKMAFLIYDHLKNKKQKIDEELENFILQNNLNNDIQMKSYKRKMNNSILNMPLKNILNTSSVDANNINKENNLFVKKENSTKKLNMISPDDVLSSSEEDE